MTDLVCVDEIDGEPISTVEGNGHTVLPASHRRYVHTSRDRSKLEDAFRTAVAIEEERE